MDSDSSTEEISKPNDSSTDEISKENVSSTDEISKENDSSTDEIPKQNIRINGLAAVENLRGASFTVLKEYMVAKKMIQNNDDDVERLVSWLTGASISGELVWARRKYFLPKHVPPVSGFLDEVPAPPNPVNSPVPPDLEQRLIKSEKTFEEGLKQAQNKVLTSLAASFVLFTAVLLGSSIHLHYVFRK